MHHADFDSFCEFLMPLGALNSPSELHGMLCGKLCGGLSLTEDQCLEAAWDLLDISGQPDPEANAQIWALYQSIEEQLGSGEYNLQLLLPDDETELEVRTQALSQWCHGFLTGFGSAGIDPNTEFSSDHAGALRDLAAIVQASVDDDQDIDLQESGYMELTEYVRVVVLNFYEENFQAAPKSSSSGTVH